MMASPFASHTIEKVVSMRQFLALLFLAVPVSHPSVARADEPEPVAKISLEDAPTTVDAALKRLSEQTEKMDARLAEIQAAHEKEVSEAKAETIGYLKTIAKDFAGQGEIPEAMKVWVEVLKLDPENESARDFLKAIGRLDIVQKKVAKTSTLKKSSEQIQRVEFRCESGRIFRKLPNGTWSDVAEGAFCKEVSRDDRHVLLERTTDGLSQLLTDGIYLSKQPKKSWSFIEFGGWVK